MDKPIKDLEALEAFLAVEEGMCTACKEKREHYREVVKLTFTRWIKDPINGVVFSNFPKDSTASLHFKIPYGGELKNLLFIYAQHDSSMHYQYQLPADPHIWNKANLSPQKNKLDQAIKRYRLDGLKGISIDRRFTVEDCLYCIDQMVGFVQKIKSQ